MANSEACDLYIEQQIAESLEAGKTPYAIGQEVAEWVNKLFETQMNPETMKPERLDQVWSERDLCQRLDLHAGEHFENCYRQ